MRSDRPHGPISRIVGLYQMVLRRTLEHFFPDAQLEVSGDRSIIDWDGSADETYYRLHEDPDGLGVEIEWLGTHLAFQPGNPSPLLAHRAPSGRGDCRSDRPAVSRTVQPGVVASIRPISVPDRRPDRRRLSRYGRPPPHPRGAGGAAGRGVVDLRKPASLDRCPPARHGARSGRPGLHEPGGSTDVSTLA